ncbi:uncharacterized protein LOC103313299 [Tribolium castaneum]|uniref:Uncharacterized protein n=1 Tax=Tribolium castaneum TaxID=7070 RepID=D2A4J9_TRICA|nr:PREDICTED: uncharacterized protein LOC103313299 [Tribolium castaneum]EFA05211.2 hypothetical protein TcasGA2_TC015351 [Tribolium castaneum]|eukprot:XP_008194467.1 PREDICTED: uncharacterized protein LOC103313299 [Tribolium castaneum]
MILSPDMSLKTYKKRSGTSDQGKEYEWLLCVYYAIQLSLSSEISDFELCTNNAFFGDFDDVTLRVRFKDGVVKVYLLQTKHSEQPKTVTVKALTSDEGGLTIYKYEKSYENTLQLSNFVYILFTNRTAKFKDKTQLDEKISLRHSQCVARNFLNTAKNSVYKFESEQNSDFYQRFYLYTNQKNVSNLHKSIADLLQTHFQTDIKSTFVDFMRMWWARNFMLSKSDIVAKLVELTLSPMIQTLTCDIDNEKTKLLQAAIMRFDLTLVEQNGGSLITQIWHPTLDNHTIKTVSMTGLKYGLVTQGVSNLKQLTRDQQSRIAWYMNLWPLVVKVDETKRNQLNCALNLLKQNKKRVVLLDHDVDMNGFHIFRNLSDLLEGDTLRSAIMQKFNCSLQGKLDVTLAELGSCLMSHFKVDQLVQIATGTNFNIGEPLEILPPTYIERKFPKIILDCKVIEDSKQWKICLSCNNQKEQFREKITKRMVKITTAVTGFANFPKHYVYATDGEYPKELTEEKYRYYKADCHFRVTGQNVQWLSNRDRCYEFINEIVKYVKNSNEICTERQLDDNFHCNVKVLTSHTGSGKTSLLKSVKNRALTNCFVMLFDLREHSTFFQKSQTSKEVWNYVTKFYAKNRKYNEFETGLLKEFPKQQTLILWDSFDELSFGSREKFVKVVSELRMLGVSQWITSKNHFRQSLENEFQVFALSMVPFHQIDQIQYLEKRCGVSVNLIESNFLSNCQILDNQEYLGIPLQLYIISDIFNKNPKLLEGVYSLADMFRALIEGRYQHFLSKHPNHEFLTHIINDSREYRLDQYKIAAVKTHLSHVYDKLNLKNTARFIEDVQNGDFLGLVNCQDDEFVFEFKILGEYLAALFLSENCQMLDLEFIFEVKYRNIRFLFDLIMAEGQPDLISLLYKNFDRFDNFDTRDKMGRNALHLICSYGIKHPLLRTEDEKYAFSQGDLVHEDAPLVKQLVKNLTLKCDVGEKDKLFNWTCFDYADRSLSLGLLELLPNLDNVLPTLSNFNDMSTVLYYALKFDYQNLFKSAQRDITFVKDTNGVNFLHVATEFGREHFLTWLLTQKVYIQGINMQNSSHWAPIQIASFNGNLTFLKLLQTKGATFPLRDPSLVSLATSHPHRHILDFLIECECSVNEFYHHNYFTRSLPLAISHGLVDIVKFLVKNGAKFYNVGKNNMNALHMALEHQQYEIADVFLEHGINIDQVDGKQQSSVHHAAQNNHPDVIEWLLARGAKINIFDKNQRNALHWAAHSGSLEAAKVLIKAGIDIDVSDDQGLTPLHLAVLSGQLSIVTLLLDAKCDFKPVNVYKRTPLHLAAMNDLTDIVQVLLQQSNSVDCVESLYGRTPLHYAAWNGHPDCVKTLLLSNASFDIRCNFGYTPLHLATEAENYDCCRLLLEAGARFDIANRNGTTALDLVNSLDIFMLMMTFDTYPIHTATSKGNYVAIPEIVTLGHDINQFDSQGMRPLHLAVNLYQPFNTVRTLLDNGANVNLRDKDGYKPLHHLLQGRCPDRDTFDLLVTGRGELEINAKTVKNLTPLHIAAQAGCFILVPGEDTIFEDLTQLLLDKGANIEACDDDGFTPLHYAAQSGNLTIVKLLTRDNLINQINRYIRTPLHMAAVKGHHFVVKYLIDRGAQQINDYEGDTPLDDALKIESIETIKLLTNDLSVTNRKKRNVLHMAAKQGLLDLVETFQKDGIMTSEDCDGTSPAEEALYNRHFKVFDIMDLSNFDVNKYSRRYKKYPLHVATNFQKLRLVEKFVEMGARTDVCDSDGNTPFYNCDDFYILQLLVKSDNSGLNVQNNKGETVLHFLAKLKHILLEFLVDQGGDVNLMDNDGNTVLDILLNRGIIVKNVLFKTNGFDWNKTNRNGDTLLHIAINYNMADVVQWLLDRGASTGIKNLVIYALRNSHAEIVRLLIKYCDLSQEEDLIYYTVRYGWKLLPELRPHISPSALTPSEQTDLLESVCHVDYFMDVWDLLPDADVSTMATDLGDTPLHLAVSRGNLTLTKRLLKSGLKPNDANRSGETPTQCAVKRGHFSILYLLLENDKNAVIRSDQKGNTLLHDAASEGNLEIVKFLLKKGFRNDICNGRMCTAADVAKEKGHEEVYQFLKNL